MYRLNYFTHLSLILFLLKKTTNANKDVKIEPSGTNELSSEISEKWNFDSERDEETAIRIENLQLMPTSLSENDYLQIKDGKKNSKRYVFTNKNGQIQCMVHSINEQIEDFRPTFPHTIIMKRRRFFISFHTNDDSSLTRFSAKYASYNPSEPLCSINDLQLRTNMEPNWPHIGIAPREPYCDVILHCGENYAEPTVQKKVKCIDGYWEENTAKCPLKSELVELCENEIDLDEFDQCPYTAEELGRHFLENFSDDLDFSVDSDTLGRSGGCQSASTWFKRYCGVFCSNKRNRSSFHCARAKTRYGKMRCITCKKTLKCNSSVCPFS